GGATSIHRWPPPNGTSSLVSKPSVSTKKASARSWSVTGIATVRTSLMLACWFWLIVISSLAGDRFVPMPTRPVEDPSRLVGADRAREDSQRCLEDRLRGASSRG